MNKSKVEHTLKLQSDMKLKWIYYAFYYTVDVERWLESGVCYNMCWFVDVICYRVATEWLVKPISTVLLLYQLKNRILCLSCSRALFSTRSSISLSLSLSRQVFQLMQQSGKIAFCTE